MASADFPDRRYLITAPELASRLNDVTLVDLRPAEDFAVGHIAGSTHVDIYGVSLNDSSEAPLNSFLAIFRVLFGSRGVRADRPAVIYDHESGERAARAVWLLSVLGHPDVRILDGGTHAWLAAGQKLVRLHEAPPAIDPTKAPPTPPPFRGKMNMDLLATRFDVHKAIGNPAYAIVDVRREAEYRGSEKRARRVGTIPGAVHVFWREHLDAEGAFRKPDEIRALYESRGVTPDKTVIPVCHGGYRSASTFIALKSLGYPDVRNYVSAWGEWGNREDSVIVIPEN
ncbi:MAG: rhodanese-like domain-containing protein [Betaproteobacteria bacterium]|jgi:thiosulfate/3-mercaptopyruvate sulfurtransferase|nr:rhodanese-like domain-containing protein [Betaproteobacteria bacterium]MDH5343191.1 rhodanese-like domain-containing protein [Betaproteobacteria bacterium]